MDGLLVVDKPVGPTSHDVVVRVRKAARERRVGHTGTLDPGASGVLPLVLGRATRLARFLSGVDKTYEAIIHLGVATDTYDSEGERVRPAYEGPLPSRDEIDHELDAFRGTFLQQPPVYSAKKIGGRRSYEIARSGRSSQHFYTGAGAPASARTEPTRATARQAQNPLARRSAKREGGSDEHGRRRSPVGNKLVGLPQPVSVTVHSLELLALDGPRVTVRVHCSAGFYVRSLAHDLGERLGIGAHLAALRRTRSGDLTLANAVSLEAIETSVNAVAAALVPPARMLLALDAVVLTGEGVRRARHGRDLGPFDYAPFDFAQGRPVDVAHAEGGSSPGPRGAVRLLDESGDLVAVGEPAATPGLLHPAVVLV